jgi:hypothetical protein
MWLKKPNPGLTRYLLKLARIEDFGGTHNWTLFIQQASAQHGIDEPIYIACGMGYESAFHLLCDCPSLISLRMRTFLKPILSVEEYMKGWLHLHCCDSRWQVADSL